MPGARSRASPVSLPLTAVTYTAVPRMRGPLGDPRGPTVPAGPPGAASFLQVLTLCPLCRGRGDAGHTA